MKDKRMILPKMLQALIDGKVWPNTEKESNSQNIKPIVEIDDLNKIIPDEQMLFLYNPPFQTIEECKFYGEEFWNLPEVGPSMYQVDAKKTLIIGDFGLGSETVLALDYKDDLSNPSVIRFKWYSESPIENNKWIKVADSFDDFAKTLGLDKQQAISDIENMWDCRQEILKNAYKYIIYENSKVLTYLRVLKLWEHNYEFREYFLKLLDNVEFNSYRFEVPPVTKSTLKQDFEFVLFRDVYLSDQPDHMAFKNYYNEHEVVEFDNLGRDATLIVPCPKNHNSNYSHLANFMKNAPTSQKHNLLITIAGSMLKKINDKPLWLSTAGAGVSWLHVRIDERPKYYRYDFYKQISNFEKLEKVVK